MSNKSKVGVQYLLGWVAYLLLGFSKRNYKLFMLWCRIYSLSSIIHHFQNIGFFTNNTIMNHYRYKHRTVLLNWTDFKIWIILLSFKYFSWRFEDCKGYASQLTFPCMMRRTVRVTLDVSVLAAPTCFSIVVAIMLLLLLLFIFLLIFCRFSNVSNNT